MAYGSDITESGEYRNIAFALSNPSAGSSYTLTDFNYDVSINTMPFFLLQSDNSPYRRVTAQYRKDQYDQTREAGEQSLTGWWFRSQSSFHLGQGIKYFEPAQDEGLRFQYTESKGLDVWTRGQATLLRSSTPTHATSGTFHTNGRPYQYLRSIRFTQNSNTYDAVLLHDGFDIDKVFPTITVSINNKALTSNVATLTTTSAHGLCVGMEIIITGVDATFNGTYTITGVPTTTTFTYAKTASNVASTPVSPVGTGTTNVIHFVDYNAGTDDPVFAYCDDGTNAYWLTNDTVSGKLEVNKKALNAPGSTAATVMFTSPGITVTNGAMEFVKERIVMAANDKIYEFAPNATSLPTALYTHPDNGFVFTSITASGTAIYVAGYNRIQSTITKFTLDADGTMPTLTFGTVAAEMPVGEIIFRIYEYLGYMLIGTNYGIRLAVVADDGSINYGPLIVETDQPCYDFAARDSFVWCATSVEGEAGVIRLDLGNFIAQLVPAYAFDVYSPGSSTTHKTTACAFIGQTNRLAYATAYNSTSGYVYMENATELLASGYLQTGYIRYNTLEDKIFKFIIPRVDTTNGATAVYSVDAEGTEYNIGGAAQGVPVQEYGVPYPLGPQEYVAFKFVINRSASDTTKGPLFTGYQVKALPAVPRQRLIQLPVACYDHESDSLGNEVGYEGRAWDRLSQLESIESRGDTVRIEDFRTGEVVIALIEELDFRNVAPSDKRFTGYGGLLIVTARTV